MNLENAKLKISMKSRKLEQLKEMYNNITDIDILKELKAIIMLVFRNTKICDVPTN